MPIYQYQCVDCQHRLEALQKMSDPKLTDCPACGAASLRKQVTAAAFKLKGTGWYETDFKNSGKKPLKEDASTSESVSKDKTTTEIANNKSNDTNAAGAA